MSVRQLNTRSFAQTTTAYANHIRTFEQIAQNVDNAIGSLLDNWEGQGRNAFSTDMLRICQCLEDVHECMGTLKRTLDAAANEYHAADRGVSQAFNG